MVKSFLTRWSEAEKYDSIKRRESGFYESNLSVGSGIILGMGGYFIADGLIWAGAGLTGGYIFGKYLGRHFDNKVREDIERAKNKTMQNNPSPRRASFLDNSLLG